MVDEGEAQALGVETVDGVIIDLQQAPRLDDVTGHRDDHHLVGDPRYRRGRIDLQDFWNPRILVVPRFPVRAIPTVPVFRREKETKAEGRHRRIQTRGNRCVLGCL